jgi:CRP/FNR family transcriptional regulator, cyclic AMP receptor protein
MAWRGNGCADLASTTQTGHAHARRPPPEAAMPIIEPGAVRDRLIACPTVAFAAGELMLRQGTVTERLLFLCEGAVAIVRDDVTLARVVEPGAVLGDMAVILGRPHSADVRAAAPSRCHVIEDAASLLRAEPELALYVMTVLASRLDAVNGLLIEARARLGEAGAQRGFLAETLDSLGRAMRGGGVPV